MAYAHATARTNGNGKPLTQFAILCVNIQFASQHRDADFLLVSQIFDINSSINLAKVSLSICSDCASSYNGSEAVSETQDENFKLNSVSVNGHSYIHEGWMKLNTASGFSKHL